jgi:Asp-tRNA(Asn)/Glu-tRNA(Gln) amidotransferase A subunit family amidase
VPVIRLTFVVLLVLSLGTSAGPEAASGERRFPIEEVTIAQVHSALRSGGLTCRALVGAYLARIAKYDVEGPALNAIASVNTDALAEADRLDRLFAEGGLVGPLHCVPVITKDNIETKDWETTAGSLALKGFVPGRDATAIVRLKAAGAIILAKANMADLALNALTTVNRIHGRTKNPYALDRVPAGSSGGTAVALAANFGLVGLGTDTGSSVRGPAAHASIVGIRPTMGLTSRAGVIPLDVLSDVIGPMARTVEDAAAVLDVLVGWDPDDPSTDAVRQLPSAPRALARLDHGLPGVRLGVLRQAYQGGPLKIDAQITKLFSRVLADLKSLGAEVVDSVSIEHVAAAPKAEQCRGLKYDLNEYLARQGSRAPVRSLAEIIFSGRFDPTIEDDLRVMEASAQNGPGSDSCAANVAYRAAVAAAVTAAMDRHRLDVLIYPTWSQPPQFTYQVNSQEAGQTLRFATAAGFPAITVPMGFTAEVLPAGVSFLGRAWSEAELLRVANAYERATRHRRPPVLAPPIPSAAGASTIIR